jgi:hypothetical protein
MKQDDKNRPQTEPVEKTTAPNTNEPVAQNTEETVQPSDEEDTSNYVLVGSGLGIDE